MNTSIRTLAGSALPKRVVAGIVLAALSFASVAAQPGEPVIRKTYVESKPGTAPVAPVAKGAPNIIWILLDDVGYGAASTFGGAARTPVLDDLAKNGLTYTNFNTTAVCSPSRAALMTGRNHHMVGMGLLPQKLMAAEFPGYTGRLLPKDGTIAEYLRARGYSTYMLGKWHLTPDEEATELGPFDRWPTGKGFDHWLGFLGGAVDQYKPPLVEDNQYVKPDGRHLTTQLTDKAIFYIDRQQKLNPHKPFFMYFSTGATHEPLQVDREWIDKNKGRFDEGWDAYREKTFARQKELGVIPANAKLPPRSPRVPAWDSLSADQKRVYARLMEIYSGFFEHTDYEIGRLIAHLKAKGLYDNTVIMFMVGDNGADPGGGPIGEDENTFPKPITKTEAERFAKMLRDFEKLGGPEAFTHYPIGWAQAANTPYRDWKTMANSAGGTRNPLVIHWPKGLAKKGEVRTQYSHLIDLLPTTLEIAGAQVPAEVRGIKQTPIQGKSLVYSFADAKAPARRTTQYYFLYGSGAIYHDGWKASFGYRPDFIDLYQSYPPPRTAENFVGKEVWELYNVNEDPTELNNLASKHPVKLAQMKALFDNEAKANQVYPLINWSDLHVGIVEFQRKAGLLPGGDAPKK
jgi:arylsulfatase